MLPATTLSSLYEFGYFRCKRHYTVPVVFFTGLFLLAQSPFSSWPWFYQRTACPSSLLLIATVKQLDGGAPSHFFLWLLHCTQHSSAKGICFLDPHHYILTSNLLIVILRAIWRCLTVFRLAFGALWCLMVWPSLLPIEQHSTFVTIIWAHIQTCV